MFALNTAEFIYDEFDEASSTEMVDPSSIPGRVKPKTTKLGIHRFPA